MKSESNTEGNLAARGTDAPCGDKDGTATPLFDVRAVNIKTRAERLMTERLDEWSAEAFIKIAVFRRGVEEEFYVRVPTGTTHFPTA